MAFYDSTWYIHSGDGATIGYYAVTPWSASLSVSPGKLIRQATTPAIGSERVFILTNSATVSTGTTEPTWVLTRGARTIDATAVWLECTGCAAFNGDVTHALNWSQAKASGTPSLGAVIKRNSGASYQICTTAGTLGAAEPAFSDSPGTATLESGGTAQWMCVGLVGVFATWSAPHARLTNALVATWGVAGNDYWVADNSAEISANAITLNPGTVAAPSRVFSIDHTAALPPTPTAIKPGATFTSSNTATNAISINTGGSTYWNGLTFIAIGAVNATIIAIVANATKGRFENCSFQLGSGAGATASITIGPGGQFEGVGDFINCTFGFSAVGQVLMWTGGWHTWKNTPDPCFLGTIPTNPLRFFANTPASVLFEGIDFTSVGNNTLFLNVAGGFATLKNCKMHTGPVIGVIATTVVALQIDLVNCDSGNLISRNERYNIYGKTNTSNQIGRVGGASDGGVPVSHYLQSQSTFPRTFLPYNSFPLVIWNDKVGVPVTVSMYCAWTNANPPNNNICWMEAEYMGSASSPIGSGITAGLLTDLSTAVPAGVVDTVSVWNAGASARQNSHTYVAGQAIIPAAGNPNRAFWCSFGGLSAASEPANYATATPGITITDGVAQFACLGGFIMSVTITPQQKGYIYVYPKVGAVSFNLFVDPRLVLS